MKNKIIFKTLMLKGEAGSTIVSMEKTGHVGTADIYTITFNDGSTTEISLENMSAITSVEKTSSTDTEDIYTITCADGSTQTFSVLNHNADIAAMSDDIDTIDARVDNFINSVVPNTVETLWTGSIKDVGDSATLSKAVSNFDYIDLYLLGSADSKYIRVPATQTAVDIQLQNLSDDASSNFLRLWEMGVSISGSTVSITKSIAWAWDDPNNSNPTVTANAQNSIPITRIDGVKVASDTPAEVTDIRVGADGTTYNSAGAAVRGQISDLKSALNVIQNDIDAGTRTFIYNVIENSYPNSSGGFDTYSGWDRSDYIPVDGNEKIYIQNPSKNTNDNVFYRQDKSVISSFSIPIGTPAVITTPADCAYIVISNKSTDFFTQVYVPSIIADLKYNCEHLDTEVDTIENDALVRITSRQLFDRNDVLSGYVTTNGNVYPDSNTYDYYPYLYVGDHVGETLYFSVDGTSYNARFVCAYDANKNAIQASGAESVASYTIPNEIKYVSISWAKNASFQCELDKITPKAEYFNRLKPKENKAVSTVCFGGMVVKTSGDLTSGESFSLDGTCSKKNNVFVFYGKISAFTGIRIGQGLGYSRGYNIHVTPTGISWQNGTTDGSPIQHGLTITDYIGVVIDIDNDGISHVTISTNGGAYTRNVAPWLGSDMEIFATADSGTTLTDCEFSFAVKDVKKPIWYFGDSYISNAETRWPYYINAMGYYKNLYMDGFSGANSSQIYPDVIKLFDAGVVPKYLIWGLGMNEADDGNVNSTWLAYYTLLRDLCDKNNVQLILCTIPNTPIADNSYKNAIVKTSGLPFIDYASAVNTAVNSSSWYSGMLSSDNVHPTTEGARALANRLIADMPIITE